MKKKNGIQYHLELERLWIRSSKMEIENTFKKKPKKLNCMQISSAKFYLQTRTTKSKINMFSASMVDIDKILTVKPKIKPKTIISEQYGDDLNVFDENETNQLPPIRGEKKNHDIELLKKKPTVPWAVIQHVKKRTSGIEKNIDRISG